MTVGSHAPWQLPPVPCPLSSILCPSASCFIISSDQLTTLSSCAAAVYAAAGCVWCTLPLPEHTHTHIHSLSIFVCMCVRVIRGEAQSRSSASQSHCLANCLLTVRVSVISRR